MLWFMEKKRERMSMLRYVVSLALVALIAASCAPKKPAAAGSIDPAASKTWNDRSAKLNSAASYQDAAVAADTAIRFNPENAFAWNNKSMALIGLGDHAGALAAAERSLELIPNNPLAWNNRGVALRLQGRFGEALRSTEQALMYEQQNGYLWYNKACYTALMGDRETALQSLSRAVKREPRLKNEAVREPDLKSLREDHAFMKIVEQH
jgi:tetratricopeptide (TPR) repeat protein